MGELGNPHDRFFKEAFSRKDAAVDFFRYYLPAEIVSLFDLSSAHLIKDSFVDKELQEHFSDLLYQLLLQDNRNAYIYVLFEHKSYPDPLVAFQLLRYMVRIWEYTRRQSMPLSPIFPIVVYHGEAKWRIGLSFHEVLGVPEPLQAYTPNFQYWLSDLSQYPDEIIKGEIILRVALLLLKHIFSKELHQRLPEIFTLLQDLLKQQTGMDYLESVLRYLGAAGENITEEELNQAVKSAFPEGGVKMSTIAQKWFEQGQEQGIQQGMQQGIQQGMQQGIQQGMQQGIQQGILQGLLDAIELGLELKFGEQGLHLLPEIRKIKDQDVLHAIREGIKIAKNLTELRRIYQQKKNENLNI